MWQALLSQDKGEKKKDRDHCGLKPVREEEGGGKGGGRLWSKQKKKGLGKVPFTRARASNTKN